MRKHVRAIQSQINIWRYHGLEKAGLKPCPVCKGSGIVVAGYGVICTEIVEKVKKCPACTGNGFQEPDSSLRHTHN